MYKLTLWNDEVRRDSLVPDVATKTMVLDQIDWAEDFRDEAL